MAILFLGDVLWYFTNLVTQHPGILVGAHDSLTNGLFLWEGQSDI